MGLFERYLSVRVALAIVVGVVAGISIPSTCYANAGMICQSHVTLV